MELYLFLVIAPRFVLMSPPPAGTAWGGTPTAGWCPFRRLLGGSTSLTSVHGFLRPVLLPPTWVQVGSLQKQGPQLPDSQPGERIRPQVPSFGR